MRGGSNLVVLLCVGGYVLILLWSVVRRSARDRVRFTGSQSTAHRRLMREIDRHGRTL